MNNKAKKNATHLYRLVLIIFCSACSSPLFDVDGAYKIQRDSYGIALKIKTQSATKLKINILTYFFFRDAWLWLIVITHETVQFHHIFQFLFCELKEKCVDAVAVCAQNNV